MSSVLDDVLEGFEPSPQMVSVMAGTKPAAVLGIDIGTSGVRASLFDDRGEEMDGAAVRLQRSTLDDVALINADEGLELVWQTIDALLAKTELLTTAINVISISCFWHSLVGIDADARVTTPVFTWVNKQANSAAAELRRSLDERKAHVRTGCRFHPSYWPAKLVWLRNEQPEAFAATTRWLSFGELLVLRLFGETAASVSMASGTGLFNQHSCDWDSDLIESLGLDRNTLPEIADTHTNFHGLSEDFAERWPQLAEARVFPPIGDGAANAIGSGCVTTDRIALMVGTSGAMRVLYKGEPPHDLPPELWCYRADKSRVVVGGALSDGGNLYRWLRESLLPTDDTESIEESLELLQPDAHGLTILPFWSGERSTGWSLDAQGVISGLSQNTQPIEILQAGMEAVAYRFALIARALAPFAPGAAIVASGTALRFSGTWTQMIADVLGVPITLSDAGEASTRGAALLALEAAGKIQNIETSNKAAELAGRTFAPDLIRHARYQAGLERQQRFYKQVIGET
jgi:gluconokinase